MFLNNDKMKTKRVNCPEDRKEACRVHIKLQSSLLPEPRNGFKLNLNRCRFSIMWIIVNSFVIYTTENKESCMRSKIAMMASDSAIR